MRMLEVVGPRKRKRKQAGPLMLPTTLIVPLWVVLVVALVASLYMSWSLVGGQGAVGEGRNPRIFLPRIKLDPQQVASGFERVRKVIAINSFFARRNSPLAGLGQVFVGAEKETGVGAELIAAITLIESSCGTDGSLSRTNHNAWGMKGPQPALGIPAQNGFCWWPDWPSAIHGAARFIRHYWGPAHSARELRGYACGSGSWAGSVESTRQSLI